VDDAADLVQLGIEKQQNVRAGVDLMAEKAKEYLEILNKIKTNGKRLKCTKKILMTRLKARRMR